MNNKKICTIKNRKILKHLTFIALIAILNAALVACNSTEEQIRLSGFLEAKEYNVVLETQGKIDTVLKKEGEVVNKGDVVATLDSGVHAYNVKQLEALVESNKSKLNEVVKGARSEELNKALAVVEQGKSSLSSANKAVEAAQVDYNYAQENYKKADAEYKNLKISNDELKDLKYKLDSASKALEDAKERTKIAQAQLNQANEAFALLKNGASSETIQIAKSNLDQAISQLDSAKLVLDKYNPKSPVNGIIIISNANPGQVLNQGANIAVVADMNDLFAKMYVPQKYISKVALNKEIELNFFSDKNLKVKGTIVFISSKSEYTPKNIETDDSKENSVFAMKVKLTGDTSKFRPGMTLETSLDVR